MSGFRNFAALLLAGATIMAGPASVTVAAQTAMAPVSAYGDLPNMEDAALSPGGRLAMLTRVNGKRVVLALDEKMQPLTMVEVGDVKVRRIDWIGEDRIEVVRTDTLPLGDLFLAKKAEFANTMIIPTDSSGEIFLVFDADRSIFTSTFGSYGKRLIDGRWYGYYGGLRMEQSARGNFEFRGGSAALYKVDMQTGKASRVTSAPNRHQDSDWLIGANGSVEAEMVVDADNKSFTLSNGSGKTIARGSVGEGSASLISFGKDGSSIIYALSDEDGNTEWFEIPMAGGQPQQLWADLEVETVFMDRLTGRMTGYREEGEDAMPGFLDPGITSVTNRIEAAFKRKNGRMEGWTPAFDRMLVSTSGTGDSRTWYMIDTAQMQANQIGQERPQIGPD